MRKSTKWFLITEAAAIINAAVLALLVFGVVRGFWALVGTAALSVLCAAVYGYSIVRIRGTF